MAVNMGESTLGDWVFDNRFFASGAGPMLRRACQRRGGRGQEILLDERWQFADGGHCTEHHLQKI